MRNLFLKRLFDLAVSTMCVIILSPLIILIGILVRLIIGKPVLFSHLRPGLDGEPFRIYKFRTMTNERDPSGELLPDTERITPLGKFLRTNSLDELPEFYNVIVGQMSLVGPRPLLMEYLDRYSAEQNRRHEVLPGITGWAQIHGRNRISWEKKFELDVWYVDHGTFWLDIKILFITLIKIIKREGIDASDNSTMCKFTGKKND